MDGVLGCKIIGLKIRSCKTIDESQLTLPLPPTRNAQLNVALLKKGSPLERLALFQKKSSDLVAGSFPKKGCLTWQELESPAVFHQELDP